MAVKELQVTVIQARSENPAKERRGCQEKTYASKQGFI